jgi:hypothetical protein
LTATRTPYLRLTAAAVLAAALSACAAQPPAGTTAIPAARPTAIPTASPVAQPPQTRDIERPAAPAPKDTEVARLPHGAVPIPAPRIDPAPIAEHLMGRGPDGVTRTLGAPSFRRKDPPAEVWQYRGERCILDIFFLPGGSGLRVAHVAIRGYDVATVAEADCLADLAVARTAPAKG